jgi:signal transduction histidine kinase
MKRNKNASKICGEVLLCAPFGKDAELLKRIVVSEGSECMPCKCLDEVARRLSSDTHCILLTEEALSTAVRKFREILEKQEAWSDIPIILMASGGMAPSVGTLRFVAEVTEANISILERPARVPTIVSVLRTATRARKRQREIQSLLLREIESASQLRAARDELEKRVEERTAALSRANLELTREVSERQRAETDLRNVSAKMLRVQDDERRRIARDLHDGVGQTLAGAIMAAAQARSSKEPIPTPWESGIRQMEELLQLALSEVRTVSHLLHPPLLDETGLMSAIRWYTEGFSGRSNISITLDLDEVPERLNQDLETAIFRIIQECLTNVHRHSEAKSVFIRLKRDDANLSLTIRDDGKGIPSEVLEMASRGQKGVGLAGMRERSSLLGGEFQVVSKGGGTTVSVVVPLRATTS